MDKQSLFISYCWKDGNTYADELETQLKEKFDVQRDKSQLIPNDDIYEFMAQIANCDNVVIVLTTEYAKSLNCMLEMSFLLSQEDWEMKTMVLVIDDSLYSVERKLEILNYWLLRQKRNFDGLNNTDVGKTILEEEKEYIDQVCNQIEKFLKGISRRKNPSQIAIVNEIVKMSMRNRKPEQDMLAKGEKAVLDFLEEHGQMTIKELSEKTGRSHASISRMVASLCEKAEIEKNIKNKTAYVVRRKD